MIVLSLFDGIGVGLLALKAAGIKVDLYLASEVDKDAIKVAMDNHPEIVQAGRVEDIFVKGGKLHTPAGVFPLPGMIIGGSPCTGFALQGKAGGFADPQSMLFWHYVRLLKAVGPRKYMLENVILRRKEWVETVNYHLHLDPYLFDAAAVSAQSRPRYYWCNWLCPPPKIIQADYHEFIDGHIVAVRGRYPKGSDKSVQMAEWKKGSKTNCLTTVAKDNMVAPYYREGKVLAAEVKEDLRPLTRRESEILQTLPVGYTKAVSESKARKLIGKSWNAAVVADIFKSM